MSLSGHCWASVESVAAKGVAAKSAAAESDAEIVA